MSLGIAYAPAIEGPYHVLNNNQPIFEVDGQGEAEDPFLWKDTEGYHILFKDHVAKFTGERGGGVMAHSENGIQWTVDKAPKAYSLYHRMGRRKSGDARATGTPLYFL